MPKNEPKLLHLSSMLSASPAIVSLGKIGFVLIEEAGMLDLSLLLLVVDSADFEDLIMSGDDNQLDSAASKISGPFECTKEIGQSFITYLRFHH